MRTYYRHLGPGIYDIIYITWDTIAVRRLFRNEKCAGRRHVFKLPRPLSRFIPWVRGSVGR